MNKLEKHIKENLEMFDTIEPSEGHMARFREKLSPATISLYARIPYGLKIAAVLVLVAVTSILVFEQAQKFYTSYQKPLQEIIPDEYGEAQVYYTSLINQRYSEIDQLITTDPERREILMKELDDMDRLFHFLLKDLQTNPSDERVLSAMITHYQMKLEIMGQIIQQLEKAYQINTTIKSHENKDV